MRTRGQVGDTRTQSRCTIIEVDDEPGHFFCPGCGEPHETLDGNRHHVIAHADGGLSERWNVLMICASCHARLHSGTRKDKQQMRTRLHAYMSSRYGLLFLLQYPEFHQLMRADVNASPLTLQDYRLRNTEAKTLFEAEYLNQLLPGVLHTGSAGEPYKGIFPL